MADISAQFDLELNADPSSVDATAASLDDLRDSLFSSVNELSSMRKALRNLKGDASGNAGAVSNLTDRVQAQKAKVAGLQAKYVDLGGTFERNKKSQQELTSQSVLQEAVTNKLSSSLGVQSSALSASTIAMGAAIAGAAALAAGMVLVAASVAKATKGIIEYGLAHANARRNEQLSLEGLVKVRRWHGIVGGSATFLQGQIDKVTASTAISRDSALEYAKSLQLTGLRGGALQQTLRGMAIVASTQGDAEAKRFRGMAIMAARAGGSIKALADDAEARLGGIMQKRLLSLDVQMSKLKENVGRLFDDIKIDGFLKGLAKVTSLFQGDQQVALALKETLNSLFGGLEGSAEGAGSVVKSLIQGLTIGMLEVRLGLIKTQIWFKKTFGPSALGGIDAVSAALTLGRVAIFGIVASLGFVAAGFAAVTAAVSTLIAPFVALGSIAASVFSFFKKIDWTGIGKDIVSGLIAGITGNFSLVGKAMSALGNKVKTAFKESLGIRSPSRVMAEEGIEVPRGAAVGIDRGTPELQAAVGRMSSEVSLRGPEGNASSPKAGIPSRQGNSFTMSPGAVQITIEGGSSEEMLSRLEDEVTKIFERAAATLGAA